VKERQELQNGGAQAVDGEFRGEEALHARLDGRIDEGLLVLEGLEVDGADNGILTSEDVDQGGLGVLGLVDLDVRREGGCAGRAAED